MNAQLSQVKLFERLVFLDKTCWTPEQRSLYDVKRTKYEGRGERSIENVVGLEIQKPSNTSPDIKRTFVYRGVEYKNIEVKELITTIGKGSIDKLKLEKEGSEAYVEFLDDLFEMNFFSLEKSVRKQLYRKVTRKMFSSLPTEIVERLEHAMKMTTVINWDSFAVVSPYGYLFVPRIDFDEAFKFYCVSRQCPKYELQEAYIEKRLRYLESCQGYSSHHEN